MATKNLLIRGGADFSGVQKEVAKAQKTISGFKNNFSGVQKGVQKEVAKAQKTLSGFQNNVSGIMKKVGAVLGTIAVGTLVKESTKMAMSVEGAIENINRNMGTNALAFQDWVNNQAKGFGIAKADAYKYGSTFSNLLGSFSKSTEETAKSTEELMKASAIIASKTGRSYEDTSERIRSGMLGSTEAIEDLGVYTNISMLQSTEAFKKFAGDNSWAQLDFQTQQQIRLAAILEQTYARYGNELADTTQTRHAQFIASLKNVQLSLGQAFLPIYNAVLPPLTYLANALGKVINLVAQFTQAIFGKPKSAKAQTDAANQQASAVTGLGDATESAGKKAKKAAKDAKSLMGFDELNTLNKNSESSDDDADGGGSVGDIGGIPSLDTGGFIDSTVEVSEKVQAMVDKIKNSFNKLKDIFINNKEIITSVLGGIIAAFASFAILSNWTKIIEGLQLGFYALGYAISGISWPIVAISALIGLFVGNIIYLWKTNEDFRNSVIEIWSQLCSFISTVWNDMWGIVKGVWDKYGQTLINNLVGFMKAIQSHILTLWNGIIKPIITNALEMLQWLWDKHLKDLVKTIMEFIMNVTNAILELYNKFFAPLINILVNVFKPIVVSVFNYVANSIGTAIAVISDVLKGLIRTLSGLIDFIVGVFTLNWGRAWQGIQDIFGGIFDGLVGLVKWPLNMIIDLVNSAIDGLNSLLSFKMPGFLGGGEIGVKLPKIPKLAKGGVVDSGQIYQAGEAGKEVIMPLENNTGWITELADKLGSRLPTGNTDSSISGDLTLMIDGSVIGKVALAQLRKMQRQGGMTLIPT